MSQQGAGFKPVLFAICWKRAEAVPETGVISWKASLNDFPPRLAQRLLTIKLLEVVASKILGRKLTAMVQTTIVSSVLLQKAWRSR